MKLALSIRRCSIPEGGRPQETDYCWISGCGERAASIHFIGKKTKHLGTAPQAYIADVIEKSDGGEFAPRWDELISRNRRPKKAKCQPNRTAPVRRPCLP